MAVGTRAYHCDQLDSPDGQCCHWPLEQQRPVLLARWTGDGPGMAGNALINLTEQAQRDPGHGGDE